MTAAKTDTSKPSAPQTLREFEKVITDAESSFIAKGDAFKAIREGDLFKKARDKVSKTDFGTYVTNRWDYSPSYISRLISGAAVAKLAMKLGFNVNEGQARELHGLLEDPEALEDILNKATSQGELRLTASAIRAARMALAPVDAVDPNPNATADPAEDTDPNDGENWPVVIRETKKRLNELVREMPAQYGSDLADMLSGVEKLAKRKHRKVQPVNAADAA